jgi:nucleoid DNA-binding protein
MTLTKRDLVVRITAELEQERKTKLEQEAREQHGRPLPPTERDRNEKGRITQQQVGQVLQRSLDYITEALAKGDKVELRNFGVFELKVRKARVGRNPRSPSTDVPIPERLVVKFKAGKEMCADVMQLPLPPKAPAQPTRNQPQG